MLPSSLPEFDYEPYFNIGVMLTGAESEKGFEGTSRLGRDDGGKVQILRADGDVDGSGNESSRLVRSSRPVAPLFHPAGMSLTFVSCVSLAPCRRWSGGWTGSESRMRLCSAV